MTETVEATSTETEMMVLGALLNNEENTKIGLKLIHDDDFFEPKHKLILKAIQHVFIEKAVVDTNLIANKLKIDGHTETIGGLSYLITLSNFAGTSCYIEAYCDDLKKFTLKRQLLSLHNSISTDLKQGIDGSKIIEKLKNKIKSIEEHKAQAESSFRYLLENNSEAKLSEELKNISPGVSTGFTIGETDLKIPGGAISIIAAPTSHGKTSVLINLSIGALKCNGDKTVYFFTYEENGASILSKFLNTWIGKELSKDNKASIKSHFIEGNVKHIKEEKRSDFLSDKKAFFEHLIDTGRLKVVYSDMSAEELVAAIHFLKKNTNVGLICIDYMQLLRLLKPNQGSRQEELKQICLILKDCAVETGLPILLAAQFNRQVVAEADLSPTQISEAGDIERIASFIIGMWNRNFAGFSREGNISKGAKKPIEKEPTIYFEVLKGRDIGNGHSTVMDFNGNTGKISNHASKSQPQNNKTNNKDPIGNMYQ
jgi:replicative DNA helicase